MIMMYIVYFKHQEPFFIHSNNFWNFVIVIQDVSRRTVKINTMCSKGYFK